VKTLQKLGVNPQIGWVPTTKPLNSQYKLSGAYAILLIRIEWKGFNKMGKTRVGIINVTGYAGVELARLLHQHPEAELTSVTGRSAAGQRLGGVFPHLAGLDMTIEAKLGEIDFAFSAMPHKESAEEIIPLLNGGIKIVDISADFRLKDSEAYPRWYGFTHPSPQLLEQAVYGLTSQ